MDFSRYKQIITKPQFTYTGEVTKVIGMSIEARGPISNIGDLCKIHLTGGEKSILSEVVGFEGENTLLMPLDSLEGIGTGCLVTTTGEKLTVQVDDTLLGKVVDWSANPIDGELLYCKHKVPLDARAPNPLTRNRIANPMPLGVRAIDGMITVGKGQRIGIFAGSGVGKSTLLGMIARNALSDINIIALIGERGREVREFIEKDLQEQGLKRSIVVVATSDQPALVRLKAAMTATALAEFFRDQGKDVLLMMDSLTRFSMAQREIGLSIGEPPVSRGYPPSVFGIMPKLLERAGHSDKGSITGMYTVLVDGDDFNEPITDTARGILDGHIVLSRKLANKGHYPAIDVLASISRVMSDIVTNEHKQAVRELKKYLAIYRESEDLINVGAYQKGSNPEIDMAIEKISAINDFLCQDVGEKIAFEQTIAMMERIGEWMFTFTLQAVLSLKEKMEEKEKRLLGEMVAKRQVLEKEKQMLENKCQELYEERKVQKEQTIKVTEWKMFHTYTTYIEKQIENIKEEIQKASANIEKQRQVLLEAMKQRKILENLKEIQREDYEIEYKQKEQLQVDELVSYTYTNKGKE